MAPRLPPVPTLYQPRTWGGLASIVLPLAGRDPASGQLDARMVSPPFTAHKALFTQLARMLGAGMSLREAVETAATQSSDPAMAAVLRVVYDRVTRSSSTLAKAMSEFPRAFDAAIVAAVKTGEDTGELPAQCVELVKRLERQGALKKKLTSALWQPMMTAVMLVVVCLGFLGWIFPMMAPMLRKVPSEKLPMLTRVELAISDAYVAHRAIYTFLFLAMIGGVVAWARSYQGRTLLLNLLLKIPGVQGLAEQSSRLMWLQTLSVLVHTSLPMSTCLRLAADAVTIPDLQSRYRLIGARHDKVGLKKACEESGLFTAELLAYIGVGDITGSLKDMLPMAAQADDAELNNTLDKIVGFVPTIATVTIALAAGVLMTGMYGGIFSMGKGIGH